MNGQTLPPSVVESDGLIYKLIQNIRGGWCCRTGLNCRPLHYQWSALPLSYGSMPGTRGIGQKGSPLGAPVLATRAPLAQACGWAGNRPKWRKSAQVAAKPVDRANLPGKLGPNPVPISLLPPNHDLASGNPAQPALVRPRRPPQRAIAAPAREEIVRSRRAAHRAAARRASRALPKDARVRARPATSESPCAHAAANA